jgi:hypothetical protein
MVRFWDRFFCDSLFAFFCFNGPFRGLGDFVDLSGGIFSAYRRVPDQRPFIPCDCWAEHFEPWEA